MKREQTPTQKRDRLDNHLAPLGDKVLAVLRKHGPLNDLQLDPIFTRQVKMPQRENVLRGLEAAKLIRCRPTQGGGRLWIPNKINDDAKGVNKKEDSKNG